MHSLLHLLDGPAPALPRRVDDIARAWAGWPARRRWAIRGAAVLLLLLGPGLRVATSSYGPPRRVAVATHDLPAGAVVTVADVQDQQWPAALATNGVDVDAAVGARLRHGIVAGTLLRRGHLAGGGIGALVPDGLAAVAIPVDDAPSLSVGDRVDVHAPDMASIADALVIAIEDDHVWVAVPRAAAGRLAVANSRGPVSLTLLPG